MDTGNVAEVNYIKSATYTFEIQQMARKSNSLLSALIAMLLNGGSSSLLKMLHTKFCKVHRMTPNMT